MLSVGRWRWIESGCLGGDNVRAGGDEGSGQATWKVCPLCKAANFVCQWKNRQFDLARLTLHVFYYSKQLLAASGRECQRIERQLSESQVSKRVGVIGLWCNGLQRQNNDDNLETPSMR